jgi:endonuclease/exonuclease/phosphatase family metal-dependent hydrolase
VVATIDWPGQGFTEVDVVSVHLAALRKSLRKEQATELARIIAERGKPTIIMGDLNAGWNGGTSALHLLMEALDLKTYRPYDQNLVTFPKFNERLDWILVSHEFDFVFHKVLPDPVSDHLGVVAELALTHARVNVAKGTSPGSSR